MQERPQVLNSSSVDQTRLCRTALFLTALLALSVGVLTLLPLSAPAGLPGNDKLHHILGFASLALPAAVLAPHLLWRLLPLLVLYGTLIEIVQPWVGRQGDFRDALADVLGLLVGLTLGLALRRLLRLHLLGGAAASVEVRRSSL